MSSSLPPKVRLAQLVMGGEVPALTIFRSNPPEPGWPDNRLVEACLQGDDDAWSALVDKYKNMVYSIALKKGLAPDDAADVFQGVWIQAYSKLSTLRKHGSVRSWLISVTLNQCYHWHQRSRRIASREAGGFDDSTFDGQPSPQHSEMAQQEREIQVQQAIGQLSPRCQELIRLLFYVHPKVPYRQIAAKLGLAVGSIGFIRGRCLKKLHRILEAQENR